MTTITPSGYFHKRIHILPRHNRIWAYRPSSIYFSTNRNTPVSATVGLITHKISPTIQKYNLICKLYYLIHKFYIKELIIYCLLPFGYSIIWLILYDLFPNHHGKLTYFGIPLLNSYELPSHRHQGSASQCDSLLCQR